MRIFLLFNISKAALFEFWPQGDIELSYYDICISSCIPGHLGNERTEIAGLYALVCSPSAPEENIFNLQIHPFSSASPRSGHGGSRLSYVFVLLLERRCVKPEHKRLLVFL